MENTTLNGISSSNQSQRTTFKFYFIWLTINADNLTDHCPVLIFLSIAFIIDRYNYFIVTQESRCLMYSANSGRRHERRFDTNRPELYEVSIF